MSVHVGYGLSVTRFPQQLHGVCDDGLVRVDVSFASRRGHCIAEPSEARDGIVLDDLIHVRHLETVVHVPSQQRRGEQDLIASITTHEHASRSRHDVVLLGVSAHERSEIVACQTDVLEHGLHLVDLFTSARVTVVETSVELISRFHLAAPPVHQQFDYSLLSTVDLVSYDASRAFGFQSQPFRSHLTVQIRVGSRSLPVVACTIP